MGQNGKTATKTRRGNGNGTSRLTPEDVQRLFGDGYRDVEILADGSVRERPAAGATGEETVTRTLKTGRTWY